MPVVTKEELFAMVGQEIGISDWKLIDWSIARFAVKI